jgi:hypothetical protein
MVAFVKASADLLRQIHPNHRDSAENLLHYLALRRHGREQAREQTKQQEGVFHDGKRGPYPRRGDRPAPQAEGGRA